MIGSHNSFTYLKSTNSVINAVSAFWRCQVKSIQEQYKAGVRFFDVRVKGEKRGSMIVWRTCHGKASLDRTFISLQAICATFNSLGKNIMIRIILEDNEYKDEFLKQVNEKIIGKQEIVKWVAIKKPWENIYYAKDMPKIVDYTYVPWNTGEDFWYNIKNFKFSSIATWAKNNNPDMTPEMFKDTKICYFMDYV